MTQASADAQAGTGWDAMGRYQSGMGGGLVANVDADDMGRYSPLGSSGPDACNIVPSVRLKEINYSC
ncbi:hypothetical protein A2U01_0022054 [Trifolium medium]|nr:hypothetical protein [Trifolium medium]